MYLLDNLSLVEDFLDSLDVREATKIVYRQGLGKWIQFCKDRNIVQPNHKDVLAFKAFLKKRYSISTCNNYITSARVFFQHLESQKIYYNIAKTVKGFKETGKPLKDPLTPEQMERFFAVIPKDTLLGQRDFALFSAFKMAPFRSIELERANWGDITKRPDGVFIRTQGKGEDEKGTTREVPLKLYEILQGYKKEVEKFFGPRKEGDPIFRNLSDRCSKQTWKGIKTVTHRNCFNEYAKKAGIKTKRISVNSFRRSWIERRLEEMKKLVWIRPIDVVKMVAEIEKQMGWTTGTFLRYLEDEGILKNKIANDDF